MRLWYRQDTPDSLLTTKVSLYRLARVTGCWSVVGRSSLHREVRLFRIPWIERVEVTDESYTIPPRFRLERWLSRTNRGTRCDTPYEVQLRFTPRVAPVVQEAQGCVGQRLSLLASGELDLFLEVAVPEEIVPWILGFGDQVEVLKPEGLRRTLRDRAERIAQIHHQPGR
jgi:predicted DNA-binding transcriptional regulator YafY